MAAAAAIQVLTALNAPIGIAAPAAANDVTRTLHLNGLIDVTGTVTTSFSYVAIDDGAVTPQVPGGAHHLIIRAADNSVLHDQIFALEDEAARAARHDAYAHERHQPQHADHDVSTSRCSTCACRSPTMR